ncbi:MAG: sensor histidine kinase [Calditrichaeota bacterium]|nr:MAG: sensor histidine kinase [Calditrichota bacterium]
MKKRRLFSSKPLNSWLASAVKYHFELKHILVLFFIIVLAQLLFSTVQKGALQRFLHQAQDSYQKDSSERLANLTTTSLELLLTSSLTSQKHNSAESDNLIEAFNIILSQQLLQKSVIDICVIVSDGEQNYAIDNSTALYQFFFRDLDAIPPPDIPHNQALEYYSVFKENLQSGERIQTHVEDDQIFHVFVPFVPKGEYAGAVYLKNVPDFTFITREIIAGYNQSSLIFTGLVLFGFLTMFLISSYTLQERDTVHELLFTEREEKLAERIEYQKEALFTKRIYHTHHKAEKVMGFIKEDLREITQENIEDIKYRMMKYANFVSRVIYNMKWFEPQIQTIRNLAFQTDLNEVIEFVVMNIFQRVPQKSNKQKFKLDLDKNIPTVAINEFVVWEIIEPLMQNAFEHNENGGIIVNIRTVFYPNENISKIFIWDNGQGLDDELLVKDHLGVCRIFKENISTKAVAHNAGYGCFIAYEIATQHCGWRLDAENHSGGGCQFILEVKH